MPIWLTADRRHQLLQRMAGQLAPGVSPCLQLSIITFADTRNPNVTSFNEDLSGWDVSSGTTFKAMFRGASSFNQDVSGCDVSNGEDFESMFRLASAICREHLWLECL